MPYSDIDFLVGGAEPRNSATQAEIDEYNAAKALYERGRGSLFGSKPVVEQPLYNDYQKAKAAEDLINNNIQLLTGYETNTPEYKGQLPEKKAQPKDGKKSQNNTSKDNTSKPSNFILVGSETLTPGYTGQAPLVIVPTKEQQQKTDDTNNYDSKDDPEKVGSTAWTGLFPISDVKSSATIQSSNQQQQQQLSQDITSQATEEQKEDSPSETTVQVPPWAAPFIAKEGEQSAVDRYYQDQRNNTNNTQQIEGDNKENTIAKDWQEIIKLGTNRDIPIEVLVDILKTKGIEGLSAYYKSMRDPIILPSNNTGLVSDVSFNGNLPGTGFSKSTTSSGIPTNITKFMRNSY